MRLSLVWIAVLCGSCLVARGQSPEDLEAQRIHHIILSSRHLGAHGMGYNDQSLQTLSEKLVPDDIPALVNLAADAELRVGMQFALASQCENAIYPVREAAVQQKMSFIDAQDTMRLIEDFAGCSTDARERAAAMRSEIQTLSEVEHRRVEEEAIQKSAEDARIQRNALKMTDPKQARDLSRAEREEVFDRSVKAMGLKEDGPMTPAQKAMIDRIYRTMVLGESGNRPPN